jgi:hypothetical protein
VLNEIYFSWFVRFCYLTFCFYGRISSFSTVCNDDSAPCRDGGKHPADKAWVRISYTSSLTGYDGDRLWDKGGNGGNAL